MAKRVTIGLGVLQLIGLSFFMVTLIYQLSELNSIPSANIFLLCNWIIACWVAFRGYPLETFLQGYNEMAFIRCDHQTGVNRFGLLSAEAGATWVSGGSFIINNFIHYRGIAL